MAESLNKGSNEQGRVVRKPVNVNPGLKVNCSITFCLKMFFKSNVWCSLRLLQLKTAGQTKSEHGTPHQKVTKFNQASNNPAQNNSCARTL